MILNCSDAASLIDLGTLNLTDTPFCYLVDQASFPYDRTCSLYSYHNSVRNSTIFCARTEDGCRTAGSLEDCNADDFILSPSVPPPSAPPP